MGRWSHPAMIAVVVVHDRPHLSKPARFRTARMLAVDARGAGVQLSIRDRLSALSSLLMLAADAVAKLRHAHALYEQLGATDGMARVRSRLGAGGTRLRYWTPADRPAVGWGSLTGTEQRIVDLVAQGLSNREVAGQMFLSMHTIAFHLRHISRQMNPIRR